VASGIHDRAVGMGAGHAGRPDAATSRRFVPSAWPVRSAGSTELSVPVSPQAGTHFHIRLALKIEIFSAKSHY
jgi:hypothetical protein